MTTPQQPTADATVVLDPHDLTLRTDRHGGVKVQFADGRKLHQLRLVEAFPVTRRHRFILIYDRTGQEIGVLRDLKALDQESIAAVETALDRSYFLSRIKSVERVEEKYGIATWHVMTDRGPRTFEVRSRSESVWWLGPGRILIKDAHGNRYEIPNIDKLDVRSRAVTELHI